MEPLSPSQSIDQKQQKMTINGYHPQSHSQSIDQKQQKMTINGYPQIQSQYIYPGYPIPHFQQQSQVYPSSSYHSYENYPQKPAPPQEYYQYAGSYNFNNYQHTLIHESSSTASFGRLMLILMIVLIGSMCMMSLVMWFLYGTYIPEFEISSLRVTNFTATNAALTGTWIAKMVVRNTNLDMAIDFERVRSVVMYRGNILGVSSLRPFEIERNERFDLDFDVPAGDNNETLILDGLPGWVMPALAQDWSNGMVVFSLRLAMSANFSSVNRGYREESLIVSCDNLELTSSPETKEGKLSAGVGSQCLISI